MCTEPLKVQLCCSKTTIRKTIASCKSNFTATMSCLDPVLSSIRTRNAQGITITNCDVTTWSWVNLVNPAYPPLNLSLSNPVTSSATAPFSSLVSSFPPSYPSSLSLLLLNRPLSSLSLLFSSFSFFSLHFLPFPFSLSSSSLLPPTAEPDSCL